MITPDTKDWTWVLDERCPECGYDAASVDPTTIGDLTRAAVVRWQSRLSQDDVRDRPQPDVWSPLEYGCHARDVFRIFDERLQLMLEVDGARFANWDQDVTAVEGRYAEQDPSAVSVELAEGGARIAARFDGVTGAPWDRTAERSDGAVFTTRTFGRYYLHDVEHHLHDVGA